MSVTIIAEAGVNHCGDLNLAIELVHNAHKAGVDYVKFQTFKSEMNISISAQKAEYQLVNTGISESQLEMVKKLELTFDDFSKIYAECQKLGVGFLSTGFDIPSIKYLDSIQTLFKIPSGEINNYQSLKLYSELGKPVILSTGMATLEEIEAALEVLTSGELTKDDITVLHCNTEYPTPMEDVNLRAMLTIQDTLGVQVGYSDHTLGIEVPIAAVALGATVIEKHFTLDRNLPGPDHKASLEPEELAAMVTAIRNIEKAMSGDGRKIPSSSEQKNIAIARKSIHAARDLKAGHIIREEDIIPLRPGIGLSPMKWQEVIGRTVKSDIPKHHPLTWENLQ